MYLLKDLLEEFQFYNQSQSFSKKTVYKRQKHCSDFFHFTHKKNLEEITTTDIRKYLISEEEKNLSHTYINSILRSIRSFFAFCEHEEYLFPSRNPCIKVKWLREKQPIIRPFSDEEIVRMLKYKNKNSFIQSRNRLIVTLLIETAVRADSLMNIKDGDIAPDYIFIRKSKNYKEYIVPNSSFLMRTLLKYKRIRDSHFTGREMEDFLVLNRYGEQLSLTGLEKIIKQIATQAQVRKEIRASPHTFRHTAAQMMLRNGSDIFEVSKILGHADIRITETYLKSMESSAIVRKQNKNSNLKYLNKKG